MKKKKVPRPGFEDYDLVKTPDVTATFGTTLFIRKDGLALKIVFPAGQMVTFAPLDAAEQIRQDVAANRITGAYFEELPVQVQKAAEESL